MSSARSRSRARLAHIVGAPLDLGQTVRGTDVGPAALRYAGLLREVGALGIEALDLGNLHAPSPADVGDRDVIDIIAEVCGALRDRVAASIRQGATVITLGGDHSVAIGSVSGSMVSGPVGLLWIDAHGDFNTPDTSPSGNVHGMPLAVLFGHGDPRLTAVCRDQKLDPKHVALVGVRDLDLREKEALADEGIAVFTMRDIDERGMGAIAREALSRVKGAERLHVSLDIDALDPREAPGTTTAVRGGLTYREAHVLLETVADEGILCALDVVEVNPMRDVRNQTAETAVGLVLSALGKSIF